MEGDELGRRVKVRSLKFSERYGIPGKNLNHASNVDFRRIVPTICRMS